MINKPTYKILVATVPADGHFNPLTGVVMHLKEQGHDVRWYTSATYADRVAKLGLPFYPFEQALEINQDNLNEVLPERLTIKGTMARIKFDIRNLFLRNVHTNLADVKQIQQTFDSGAAVRSGFHGVSPHRPNGRLRRAGGKS